MSQVEQKVEGRVELPERGTWVLDPAHTTFEFVARHMMVTKVRGRFTELEGTIHVGDIPEDSWGEAVIKAASIFTNAPQRDEHLKSPDFLDVERWPELRFRTTAIEVVGDGHLKVDGDLTIRDVTAPITLDAEFGGVAQNPYGKQVAFFSARGEVDREQFGMTWNVALENGGWLVGKKVVLEIEAEAVKA
jgi:polyisoprenoid-binding protein YceI